jgi:peptidoglycan hydrolase-like protein with peptidoglycan-binding domain
MAKSIAASVGQMGGVNLLNDVKIVQGLLNNVAQFAGGPPLKLVVDGACGPKTKDAIKKFQMQHFGLGGADGRVDPNGRTLAKLNEFDTGIPSLPSLPPVPSPFPPLTTSSILLCPHGGTVTCLPTGAPPFAPVSGGIPLKPSDPCLVAGCGFPSPCVRVQWVGFAGPALDLRSIGLCMNAAGMAQGPVLIVKA